MRYLACLLLLTSTATANDAWVIKPKRLMAAVWVVTDTKIEQAKPAAPAIINDPPPVTITETTGSCASGTCSQPLTALAPRSIFRRRR